VTTIELTDRAQAAEATLADPPTALLVRQAKAGSEHAYEVLYRRLSPRVYALCLRMSGDSELARELVQDVFVKAWQGLGRFRGDAQFSTWLHRVAINVIMQDRRTKARRSGREELTDEIGRFDKAAVTSLPGMRIDLERAIAALPGGAKEALLLRDVHGYKYREVAVMMGVAVGTVKAQVHRARKMVREAMA